LEKLKNGERKLKAGRLNRESENKILAMKNILAERKLKGNSRNNLKGRERHMLTTQMGEKKSNIAVMIDPFPEP
jgi:hypothetical protein